jgi:sulfotransferase
MAPRFVGVAGLPRAGSTLLCQLLAEHPQIHSDGHSSPLCSALLRLRHGISDDDFFLAQLDVDFDRVYGRLSDAARGFIRGWFGACDKAIAIDKNRGWLRHFEYLLQLEPDARLLVCVRELGQIYGSIEAQHQRTILIDFQDHTAHLDRYGRAEALFSKDGVVGGPLRALEAVQDLAVAVQQRIHLVIFEDLMKAPLETMAEVYRWLGVDAHRFDATRLSVRPHESDSHYRHKYPHRQRTSIAAPEAHVISRRIQAELEKAYPWYYDNFYPRWTRIGA